MNSKKIIIIGAGISGLTAGIYALDNGYDVEIFEKHSIPGGECTGWYRKGLYIDGCAHWIVGTNKSSLLHPLFLYIGAFDDNTKIYDTEYFTKYDINGEIFTFYSDLDKLEKELLRVGPEDEKQIRKFIKNIRRYQMIKPPVNKPVSCMNLFELIKYGCSFIPILTLYLKASNTNMEDLIKKYKSPIIREALHRIFAGDYNLNSFYYTLQSLSMNDAGMVEGGSLNMINNVKEKFLSKGGKLRLSTPVKKILIKDGVAQGIILEDDRRIYSDYIISSCDVHHTFFNLLENKYTPNSYLKSFTNIKDYPLSAECMISLKVKTNVDSLPKMFNIGIEPFSIQNTFVDNISIRNHAFDKKLSNERSETLFTVGINVDDSVYDYFNNMERLEYKKEKRILGERIRMEIIKYLKLKDEDIELIDVTTPLTYERYLNAYRGSYMSFITTKKSKYLMHKQSVKNVKNLYISGQWIMPPGGLPIALFTGKHAVYLITKEDKVKFKALDLAKA